MSNVFELLSKIQQQPGMYIGRTSVRDLIIFLEGYKIARMELGIAPTEKEMEFYRQFQPWLQERYGISISASWAKLIELYTGSDELGFYRFFELLEEFWQRPQGEGMAADGAIASQQSQLPLQLAHLSANQH